MSFGTLGVFARHELWDTQAGLEGVEDLGNSPDKNPARSGNSNQPGDNTLNKTIALEFSVQYESVVAFGAIRVLEDAGEKRRALYGLIGKYFPAMTAGKEYRPITDQELKRTSVYAIAIESWSGKRNWADRAEQSDEWPPLAEKWFE